MHNQNKKLSCITHASKLDKAHGTLGHLKLQLYMPKLDKAHHGTHASMQKNVRERKGSFDHEKKTCKDMKKEKNSQDREEMDGGAMGEPKWGLG